MADDDICVSDANANANADVIGTMEMDTDNDTDLVEQQQQQQPTTTTTLEPPIVLVAWGSAYASFPTKCSSSPASTSSSAGIDSTSLSNNNNNFWFSIVTSTIPQGILFGFLGLGLLLGFEGIQKITWNTDEYHIAVSSTPTNGTAVDTAIENTLLLGTGPWWYVGMIAIGGACVGFIKVVWSLLIVVKEPFPERPPGFLIDIGNLYTNEPWEALPIALCAIVSIGCGASRGPEMPLGALACAIGSRAIPYIINTIEGWCKKKNNNNDTTTTTPLSQEEQQFSSSNNNNTYNSKLCTLDAMAAAFGPLLPSQFLAPLLIYELGHRLWYSKKYNFEFFEILTRMSISSSISFVIFFGLKGQTFLYEIPPSYAAYDFIPDDVTYILYGAILGIISGLVGLFGFIMQIVGMAMGTIVQTSIDRLRIGVIAMEEEEEEEEENNNNKEEEHEINDDSKNNSKTTTTTKAKTKTTKPSRTYLGMFLTPVIGGALVGLLAVACPLTLGDGSTQLGVILSGSETLGVDTLIVSAFVKLIAAGISNGFGFIGGDVFPYVFAGGCIGAATNLLFPDIIPILVSYSVCLAAIPSTTTPLILTFTGLSSMALALGGFGTSPVFLAAIMAYTVGPGSGFPQWLLKKVLSRKE